MAKLYLKDIPKSARQYNLEQRAKLFLINVSKSEKKLDHTAKLVHTAKLMQ